METSDGVKNRVKGINVRLFGKRDCHKFSIRTDSVSLSQKDQRKCNDQDFNGCERRLQVERILMADRRSQDSVVH